MKIQSIALGIVAILIIAGGLVAVQAENDEPGNGAPSGWHYTLNILGKDWDRGESIPQNHGHRIFVQLGGKNNMVKTKIMLTKSEDDTFDVIDCDGTDGTAEFELPPPYHYPIEEGVDVIPEEARYKVYIRVLSPNGKARIGTTVKIDDNDWLEAGEIEWKDLEGKTGKKIFEDVTQELTTVYIDITDDDTYNPVRYGLFDTRLENTLWAWDYENEGLKHVQIRFYPDEDYWDLPVE